MRQSHQPDWLIRKYRVVKAVTELPAPLNMSCAQVKLHTVQTAISETFLRTKSAGHELWAAEQPEVKHQDVRSELLTQTCGLMKPPLG